MVEYFGKSRCEERTHNPMHTYDVQAHFLDEVITNNLAINLFTTNGFRFVGRIKSHDKYTITIDSNGETNVLFKHAISTIAPYKAVML